MPYRPLPPSTALSEHPAQPQLHLPARQRAGIVDERRRRTREVEHRRSGIEPDQLERGRGRRVGGLAHAPGRAEQMPEVQNIEAQLELVARAAAADAELLQNPQVDVVVPGIELAEPVGDLAAVRVQVTVLGDKRVEGVPLLLRRLVRPARTGGARSELDLALVARDVDQVVPALAVAVHVARVDERITVASRATEAVPLACLHEHPYARLEGGRPRLRILGSTDDAVPLAEFGVAQLRPVGITLYGLVLPQDARDLR